MTKYLLVYHLILLMFSFQLNAESHHPQEFLKSLRGQKNEGEQIYNHFCVNCHALKPLIPLGAPRIEDTGDWKNRLKQSTELLFQHTDEGMNGMPSRGGCFECSDMQLILAIVFLVPKKDKKDILINLKAHLKSK